jgi:hypothetical protein
MAKSLLDFAYQSDQFVESLYPCFRLVEDEIRKNHCVLALEGDGVWRLRGPDGSVRQTGATLKDVFVNVALWDRESADETFAQACAREEDELLEPNKRKLAEPT